MSFDAASFAIGRKSGGGGGGGPIPVFELGSYNGTADCVISAEGGAFISNADNYGKPFYLRCIPGSQYDIFLCTIPTYVNEYWTIVCVDYTGHGRVGRVGSINDGGTTLYVLKDTANNNSPIHSLQPMFPQTIDSIGDNGKVFAWAANEIGAQGGMWRQFDIVAKQNSYDNKAIAMTVDDGTVAQLLTPLMQSARQSAEQSGAGYAPYPVTGVIKTMLGDYIAQLQSCIISNYNRMPCLAFGNYKVVFTGFNVTSGANTISGSFCEVDNGVMYEYTLTLATGYVCVRCVKYGS